MQFLILLALSIGLSLAGPVFNLCPVNVDNEFFIVRALGPPPKSQLVSKSVKQPPPAFFGFPFSEAEAACETFGYRLANLTVGDLLAVRTMAEACGDSDAGYWFGTLEALPIPFGCFALFPGAVSVSNTTVCDEGEFMAICQVPDDIVQFTTTSITVTTVRTKTSSIFIPTSTSTYTRFTDYSFIDEEITRTRTVTVTTHVHRRREHHKANQEQQEAETYVACTASINNFFLVENENIDPLLFQTFEDACDTLGYPVANLTIPILTNLAPMFGTCNSPVAGANSYYSFTPLCLLASSNGLAFYVFNNTQYLDDCINAQWALCRGGPPVLTTSFIQTDDFTTVTTATITRTTTITEFVTEEVSTDTTQTLTEFTTTEYFPVFHTTTTCVTVTKTVTDCK
jgi:hypothetical protein